MKMISRIFLITLLTSLFAITPTRAQEIQPRPEVPPWKPIFQGVDEVLFTTNTPRLLRIAVVRVDLRAPGIRFLVTPPKGPKLHEVAGLKTTTFLEKYKCQVVVNASPFSPKVSHEGDTQRVYCLAISNGRVYSPPAKKGEYAGLLITRDNHARIARPPIDTTGAFNAVGGLGDILRNGGVIADGHDNSARTAVGISKDGRRLFLMVVDGRQPEYSEGCSLPEEAWWLKQLGAWDAINLDGGGTTSMAVADDQGKAQLLNQPIDLFIPGRQRIAGSHLGVYALPLDANAPATP